MPVMSIPKHTPLARNAMANLFRQALDRPIASSHTFCVSQPLPGQGGDRLTRVPFLKLLLEGVFQVHGKGNAQPGESLLFAPHSFVPIEFVGPCRFLRITFEGDGLLLGHESVEEPKNDTPGRPAGHLEATWLEGSLPQPAAGLLDQLLRHPTAESARRIATTAALLWEIIDLCQGKEDESAEAENGDRSILSYLQDQSHHPINRKTAAAALGISPGHLGRIVRRQTGQDFQSWLKEVRMHRAEWLLSRTALSIGEVARQTGFSSANYFVQAFREWSGSAPGQWRCRESGSIGSQS